MKTRSYDEDRFLSWWAGKVPEIYRIARDKYDFAILIDKAFQEDFPNASLDSLLDFAEDVQQSERLERLAS